MNTETALLFDNCSNDPTFEDTKANYLVQSYVSAIAEGLRANLWYSVHGWRTSGLVNPDLSPRQAYLAFQFAQSELHDVTYTSMLNSSDIGGTFRLNGYKFLRDDRRIWVLWSLDGTIHSIDFRNAPLPAWDALGASITTTNLLEISLETIYLNGVH